MKNFLILSVLLTITCFQNPRENLEKEVKSYKAGKTPIERVGVAALKLVSTENFSAKDVKIINGQPVKITEDAISFIYPYSITLSIEKNMKVNSCSINEQFAAISLGTAVKIYSKSGKHLITHESNKNTRIEACVLSDDLLYFLQNGELYTLHCTTGEINRIASGPYSSPIKKEYTATMAIYGEKLVVVKGISGAYHIHVFNVETQAMLVTKVSASTNRNQLNGSTLYYIAGGSGQWHVNQFFLLNKRKKRINNLKDIYEVTFGTIGFAIEKKRGIFLQDYNNKAIKIPFKWQLVAMVDRTLFIRLKEKIYLFDFNECFLLIEELNSKL